MARLSRLLSAVSLGIAVTAAVGAVVVGVEHTQVHRAPTQLAEATDHARVIVKFKAGASVLSTARSIESAGSTSAARTGPRAAGVLGARLGFSLADGRAL